MDLLWLFLFSKFSFWEGTKLWSVNEQTKKQKNNQPNKQINKRLKKELQQNPYSSLQVERGPDLPRQMPSFE